MRIYEVYLDVYFIENSILDAAILLLTLFIMKRKIIPWRIFCAAVIGGLFAVLVLVLKMRYGLFYIAAVIAADLLMLVVSSGLGAGGLLAGVFYFHALAFVYTKLDACIGRLGVSSTARLVALMALTCMFVAVMRYREKKGKQRIYTVKISENGESLELKALYDTGNSLLEPISKRPVSIVEENEITRLWLSLKPQKYKVIPFRSIGEENGIMEGTMVDELTISLGDRQVVEKDAVIALYKGRLSKDGSFQMILNQGLL